MGERLSIDFFVDGAIYAHRSWYRAPRKGDLVSLLDKVRGDKNGKAVFRVVEVVWGVESAADEKIGLQGVDVYLEVPCQPPAARMRPPLRGRRCSR